ncbi:HD domain-containing protein [Clostridium sp. 'deep sea']|uniref:HD domain-containing protein n=1 Tax=Clostridium sp. 'deep sea' TaxID=2779445 RepID=UPI0018969025|nr:HD domain-containing protein [Clostridium sp. 'deep sea']QOR34975.1 HD domain-containing protein [Clostridium sp. 'deep sea']
MQTEKMFNLYLLVKDLEQMKNRMLNTYTSDGKQESLAEHSWRVAVMAYVLAQSEKDLNISRVLELSLVQDLGQLYCEEYTAKNQDKDTLKYKNELRNIHKIASYLPIASSKKVIDLWKEYNKAETKEAIFIKAIAQLETITQYIQAQNPPNYNPKYSSKEGLQFTDHFKTTKEFRAILNGELKYLKKEQDNPKI